MENHRKKLILYCKNCNQMTESYKPKLYDQDVHSKCKKCMNKKYNHLELGSGILNNLLSSNLLPELHSIDRADDGNIKRASFLGPGTNLNKRLKNYNEEKGTYDEILTPPINKLDRGALEHDLAYGKYKDIDNRNIADRKLMDTAIEIFHDPKATTLQKSNALLVMAIMEYKIKTGTGIHPSLANGLMTLLLGGLGAGGAYGLSKIKLGSGTDDQSNPFSGLLNLIPLVMAFI